MAHYFALFTRNKYIHALWKRMNSGWVEALLCGYYVDTVVLIQWSEVATKHKVLCFTSIYKFSLLCG